MVPDSSPNLAEQHATEAGLRYVSDEKPALTRRRMGDGFAYLDAQEKRVTDEATLGRIKRLVIPPAWENVWIAATANAHLQATGRDARGRKQYRYHADFRAARDETKFERMLAFARVLPRIRRRVQRDLSRRGMPREKVLAGVVKLLETTLIRIGNDEYARENKSYGLTTFRNRHAKVRGQKVTFIFRGKSGVAHAISVQDRRLAALVKRCQDLPGQSLFEYTDEGGEVRTINSQDVNEYLRSITGEHYTAKDFRTWAGTLMASIALRELAGFRTQSEAKKNLGVAIQSVAKMLGNTPTVCRKCYVHPAILDGYLEGVTLEASTQVRVARAHWRSDEEAVVTLLKRRLKVKKRATKRTESLELVLAKSTRQARGKKSESAR